MGNKRHPARGLVTLGALAAVVCLAVTAWLHLGWRATDVTLEDRSGDPGELRGFTLQGVRRWSSGESCLTFDLHDGYLDTEFFFDFSPFWTTTAAGHGCDVNYAVRPQDRAAANANAWEELTAEDGSRFIHTSTNTVRRMYTMTLPDDTCLRVAGEDVTGEDPVEMLWISGPYTASDRLNFQNADYSYWESPGADLYPQQSPTAKNPVPLGDGWALCWKRQEGDRAPGLYRASGLTVEEINALPTDGEAYGQEVLCNSTEFGTLEAFYCPADAEVALAGASMAGGYTLLLYLDAQDTLWADLVDENGQRTDHREVTQLSPDCEDYQAELLARTTDRDAVFTLESVPDADYWDKTISPRLAALRVENGKFTVVESLADDSTFATRAAVLNAQGDALLIASEHNFDGITSETGLQTMQGLDLRVQPLDGSAVTYQGRLNLGGEREWGRLAGASSRIMERVVDFPTIQKDRG